MVVVLTIVVVLPTGHGVPVGMHWSVTWSTSRRPPGTFRTTWILQLPGCAPFFLVWTVIPVNGPHGEVARVTFSFPTGPQGPFALIVFFRSADVQPGSLTQSCRSNVQVLPDAV